MTLVDTEARPIETEPANGMSREGDAGDPAATPKEDPWQLPDFRSISPWHMALLAGLSVAALILAAVLMLYTIGSLVHARDQRSLIAAERAAINSAAVDNEGLHRPALPTEAPSPGSVVGILDVPVLGLQEAVVEGVEPSQTIAGVGHVPGTAGLGQPGNSAVVGRRGGYGGPFGRLQTLRPGDRLVTATTEGQSVYVVRSVRVVTLTTPGTAAATAVTTLPAGTTATTAPPARITPGSSRTAGRSSTGAPRKSSLTTTAVYGPSAHNQLTLVTSASSSPWNSSRAVVVVARLKGEPYTPTPQEARSTSEQGDTGDPTALPWLLLALLALVAVFAGAVALYRHTSLRSAYLLTTAPILVAAIFVAEALTRLLPAWA